MNATPRPPSNACVLVVEDNPAVGRLLQTALERKGYRAPLFTDPLAALEYVAVENQSVHIAIVDYTLPNLTGVDFAKQLRDSQPAARVILTSGRNISAQSSDIASLPGVAILQKPFQLAELNRVIEQVEQAQIEAR